jgi:hypothetical protein
MFLAVMATFGMQANAQGNRYTKKEKKPQPTFAEDKKQILDKFVIERNEVLAQKITELKSYATENGYNTRVAVLIDYSRPSYLYRMFWVDLTTGKVLKKGLVAHGDCCDFAANYSNPKFSNTNNSQCTSLGKYKIGVKYKGAWGTSYKLHGLDATNNNAFMRAIVFHGHACVPEAEDSFYICTSFGCPMTSTAFFNQLQVVIDAETIPILMWAYK